MGYDCAPHRDGVRDLGEEANQLNKELKELRQEARLKMERNLELPRTVATQRMETPGDEDARMARANRHHALGLQYYREKRCELASRELERAVELNPDNQLADEAKAADHYRQYLTLWPDTRYYP